MNKYVYGQETQDEVGWKFTTIHVSHYFDTINLRSLLVISLHYIKYAIF